MVRWMYDPDRSLVLRIPDPGEPLAGEARCGHDRPRAFSTWMEMVAVIEQWRADQTRARELPAPDPSEPSGADRDPGLSPDRP